MTQPPEIQPPEIQPPEIQPSEPTQSEPTQSEPAQSEPAQSETTLSQPVLEHGVRSGPGAGQSPELPPAPAEGPATGPASQEPTAEQWAERARRANKATRGALAGVAGLEALVVLLVPRAIAQTNEGLSGLSTGLLVALAVVLIVTAGLLRRPFGIGLGSALQIALLLTGVLTTSMWVVGAVFAGIWLYLLSLRHQLVGTPGGIRMLLS